MCPQITRQLCSLSLFCRTRYHNLTTYRYTIKPYNNCLDDNCLDPDENCLSDKVCTNNNQYRRLLALQQNPRDTVRSFVSDQMSRSRSPDFESFFKNRFKRAQISYGEYFSNRKFWKKNDLKKTMKWVDFFNFFSKKSFLSQKSNTAIFILRTFFNLKVFKLKT